MSLGIKAHVVGLEQDIDRIVRKVNTKGVVLKVRANDFTQPLGRMSAKANEFTKSLEASNARVIAFGASAAIIGGVTTSFAQLVIQATKVEKILTDINVVLGTTAANLDKFGKGLFQVARNTSQALEVAAEAALEFSRQGLSMEETLKRTNDALVLTRLTGLKAADSVKGLTAAVNGFADAGLTTTQIINKLAAVDVKFAVGADDLINALSRAGAVAQDAGVQFDQLVGAVTAAQQITARGGSVIGNSFKTIFTRIQRSSTIDRLQELGIVVKDLRGSTLPALTVLTNLSKAYDGLGESTKSAVAEQVGGVFQINVLKAALKDLNKETSLYSQATDISSKATNEAQIKNAQLQKTLASISQQTLTNVRELTANLGELTIAPALKEFMELANSALTNLNKIFGDKEGDNLGHEFARGFARAVGSVLTGPGMMITILVFAKLFSQAFKFAKNSIKDLLEIKSIKDQERAIQEGIVDAMIRNVDLSKQLIKYEGDQVKQEQIVLKLLKEQTSFLEKQRSIAKSISPALLRQGVNPNLTVGKSNNKSEGFVPNFASQNLKNSVTPTERLKEQAGAMKGGYIAGPVSSMSMPHVGRVVYNQNETVKKFPGMSQSAIMPPEDSVAGAQYKKDFSKKHGFDPYSSAGYVPNFSKGNLLFNLKDGSQVSVKSSQMGPLKIGNKANVLDSKGNKVPVFLNDFENPDEILNWKSASAMQQEDRDLKKSLKPRKVKERPKSFVQDRQKKLIRTYESAVRKLKGNIGNVKLMSGGKLYLGKSKMGLQMGYDFNEKVLGGKFKLNQYNLLSSHINDILAKGSGINHLKSVFSFLKRPLDKGGLGVKSIARHIFFGGQDLAKGAKEDLASTTDKNSIIRSKKFGAKFEKRGIKGLNKGLSKNQKYRNSQVSGSSKQNNFPVDAFGQGLRPMEFKGGEWKAENIISKSLQLFSDPALISLKTLIDNPDFKRLVDSGALSNLRASSNLLEAHGLLGQNASNQQKSAAVRAFNLAGGFIPNFADPISDAVDRERAAKRGGRIYLDQDERLRNRKNPMGLLVANTRDEPISGSQGVNRAISKGLDPKLHGSSSGYIPNFGGGEQTESGLPRQTTPQDPLSKARSKGLSDKQIGAGFGGKAAKDALAKLASKANSAATASEGLMGRMFALTTITYALEGAMGDAESTAAKIAKTGNAAVMGLSQASLVTPMFMEFGTNLKAAGKEMGGFKGALKVGAGNFTKVLGVAGGALAAIIPIVQALKENFDFFKSGLEIASRDLREAAEGLGNLENVSEGLAKQQENNKKITELEAVGKGKSYEQEKQLLQLKFEERKNQVQVRNELNKLASSVGLTNSQSERLNGSYSEQVQVLQELKLAQLRIIDIIQGRKNFLENVGEAGGTNAFGMGSDGALIERAAKLRGRQFASSATSDVDFSNVDVAGVVRSLQSMQSTIGRRTPGSKAYNAVSTNKRFNLVDDADFERLGKSLGFEGQRLEQFIVDGASEIKSAFKSVSRGAADLNFEDEAQVVQFLFSRFRQSLLDMVNGAKSGAEAQEKNDKLAELQAATLAEGLKYLRDQNAAYELKHSKLLQQIQLDSKVSDFMQKRASMEQSILDSMGLMTDQAKIRFDTEQKQASFEASASAEKRRLIAEANKAQYDNLAKTLRPDRISGSAELFDETSGLKNDNAISQMANRKQDLRGAMRKSNLDTRDTGLVNSVQEGYKNILKGIEKRRREGDKIVTREELNAEILKELGRATSARVKDALISTLQSEEIIALQGNEADKLQEMLKNSDAKLKNEISFIDKKTKLDIATLSEQEKEANIRKRTALGLEIVSRNLKTKEQIDREVSGNLKEQLQTSAGFAKIDQLGLDARIKYLQSAEGARELMYQQQEVQKLDVMRQQEGLVLKTAELRARNNVLDATNIGVEVAESTLNIEYEKLEAERINLANKLRVKDLEQRLFDTATLQHSIKMGQLDLDGQTLDAKIRLYETTDALAKEVAAELDVRRKNRKIDRGKKRETFKQELQGGDFQVEGIDQIEDGMQNLIKQSEQLKGKMQFYQEVQGNQIRAAETALAYAENQKNLNVELNKGSLFADSLKVKIAEADVRAQRFAETLANTSFDSVRDGFVTMFNDLADGSKRTSTVMLEFAGTIAKKIRDKIFENAADRLTSGLFKAFGLDKYHSGGYVANYNAGGSASGDIPAMLTNGEYVVRKKVVDRIGVSTLDKINETGSLEDVYNKPNEDTFELEPKLGFASPQGFKDGGEVKGMLSKMLIGFNNGGKADYGMYRDIGYGVGAMGGTMLAGWMNRDKNDETKPPEAPNTSRVNTRSNLNLDFNDPRMSAQFRAQDRASQDYGQYLLDRYQYDVDRRNQKQDEKMALKKDLFTSLAVIGASAIGNVLGYKIKDGLTSARLKGNGISGPNGSTLRYDSTTQRFSGVDKDGNTLNLDATNQKLKNWAGKDKYNLGKGSDAAKFLRTQGMSMDDRISIDDPSVPKTFKSGFLANQEMRRNAQDFNARAAATQQMQSEAQMSRLQRSIDQLVNAQKMANTAQTKRFNLGGIVGETSAVRKSMPINGFGANGARSPELDVINSGALENNFVSNFYNSDRMRRFNSGGIVNGPAGIDKVGPVMLSDGEYVIKASSVNSIERSYPGLLDKLNTTAGYNEGGAVGQKSAKPELTETSSENVTNESNLSNNVTVNINVGDNGATSVSADGSGSNVENAKDLGSKIKQAVVAVMANEMRVGGMLSR